MKTYLIDGNNLIGKIASLKRLQNKDKQASREKLGFKISNFFRDKKAKVFLHFDGFENDPIKISKAKIIYSENKTADAKIKKQIEKSKNPKNIIVVTSDNNIKEFAQVCSCQVLSSEEFALRLKSISYKNEEEQRIKEINNIDEFKKIFNVKN